MPHSKQRRPSMTEAQYRTIAHASLRFQNLRGVDAADHFTSASSCTLGERFWGWFLEIFFFTGTIVPQGWQHDNFYDFQSSDSFWLVPVVGSIIWHRAPIL